LEVFQNPKSLAKQCDQPAGCHLQDHSINWKKFSVHDMELFDFLRLREIAPQVFENLSTSKESGFANLVLTYRNEMGSEAHVPSEFNKDFHDSTSQWKRANGHPVYDFGAMLEECEDDYDSDDSEFFMVSRN
jgi:hypothetical protein